MDECISLLHRKYSALIDKHITKRRFDPNKIVNRDRIKWFNQKIKTATNEKYRLHSQVRAASASQLPELKIKFNLKCREVKRLIKEAHRDFEMNIAEMSKSDPKILYAYVNRQNTRKERIRLLKDSDGNELTDGMDIVECLNKQYSSQFNRNIQPTTLPNFSSRSYATCFVDPFIAFSITRVKNLLNNLEPGKSIGPDGFHPHLLKECSESVSLPISLIFIKSFESSKLPVCVPTLGHIKSI